MLKKEDKLQNNNISIFASVIVSFTKSSQNIKRYFEWLSNLPNDNIEFLLLLNDDCDQLPIFEKYSYKDRRIKLIFAPASDLSLATAKNLAIKQAQGKYLLFLNYNDYLENNAISAMQDYIQSDDDVLLYDFIMSAKLCNYRLYSLEERKIPNLLPMHPFSAQTLPDHIFNIIQYDNLPCLIKTSVIRENNLSFEQNINYSNSLFGLYVMLLAKKIIYINHPFVKYATNASFEYQTVAAYKQLFKKVVAFENAYKKYNQNGNLSQSFLNRILELFWQAADIIYSPEECLAKQFLFNDIFDHFKFCLYDTDFYSNEICRKLITTNYISPVYLSALKKLLSTKDKQNVCPIVLNAMCDIEIYNAATLITSIKQSCNSNKFYDIYLLCDDKEREDLRNCFENMSEKNIRVRLVTNFKENYLYYTDINSSHYPLFIARLIDFYDKILVLSLNTVVLSDISEIFEQDLRDKALALSINKPSILSYNSDQKNIIYNTDVILINTANWNKNNLTSICLKNLQNYSMQFIINNKCSEYIYELDQCWNTQYSGNFMELDFNSSLLPNVKILNYIGEKPWFNPRICGADLWWSYAKKSPLYELIIYYNICELTNKTLSAQNISDYTQKTEQNITQQSCENSGNINDATQSNTNIAFNIDDNLEYTLMKKYIKLCFQYIFSYGAKKRDIKAQMDNIYISLAAQLKK